MLHFPNLDRKELIICNVIMSAHHDVLDGRYNYVVPVTLSYYPIFHNEKEVEDKIEELDLISKRVIIPSGFSKPSRDSPFIRFFHPRLIVAQVGQEVEFRNDDENPHCMILIMK